MKFIRTDIRHVKATWTEHILANILKYETACDRIKTNFWNKQWQRPTIKKIRTIFKVTLAERDRTGSTSSLIPSLLDDDDNDICFNKLTKSLLVTFLQN
jgi:hypothetical protein